jgi:hypothetical protein
MRLLILNFLIISLLFVSCKKSSPAVDLSDKAFIVSQVATCENGSARITNVSVGDVWIYFDSPTFTPAPNTWYRAGNPGVSPCGSCQLLFRYKTGSDVSPKKAPPIRFEADMNVVLNSTNLCK